MNLKNKRIVPFLLTAILVSFTLSCGKDLERPQEVIPKIESSALSPGIVQNMKRVLGEKTNLKLRLEIAKSLKLKNPPELLVPKWSSAKRYPQKEGYSIIVVPTTDFYLDTKKVGVKRKFVFLERDGKVTDGKIVEVYGAPKYLGRHDDDLFVRYNSNKIDGFSGSIITYDPTYRHLRGVSFKDGVKQNATVHINSSQKASPTQSLMMTTSTIQCYDRYEVTYYSDGTTTREFLYTWCEEVGGGSSGGGTSGGGGGVAIGDPGFPISPYNGLTHTYYYPDGKSVTFTYDSQMGAWLLPEIQIFKDQALTISGPTNLGGKLLSAWSIALAEPTPAGEIIMTAATIAMISVYSYHNLTKFLTERGKTHEYCVEIYEECTDYTPWLPCGECLLWCEVWNEWHNARCPKSGQFITPW